MLFYNVFLKEDLKSPVLFLIFFILNFFCFLFFFLIYLDLILLEKSLMVLAKGVVLGRRTYVNTIKYLKMAISSNFGNVFSVLIASAWLGFLPMLPIQIVIQNLIYDFSQLAIPWDNVDEHIIAHPVRWNIGGIVRYMVCLGPLSSIFDVSSMTMLFLNLISVLYYLLRNWQPQQKISLFNEQPMHNFS